MNTFMQKLGVLTLTLSAFLTASAADFEVDGISYNITDPEAKTVEVTSANHEYTGDITLPPSVTHNEEKYAVTAIGMWAFYYCGSLTSIAIPGSVTTIGEWAFYSCSGLTSITIPNSVTTIGAEAFSYCSGLTSITIPNSVTTIGESAFYDCSGLTSITIPNSVTTIENAAFFGCSGLTSITIPNSVTTIGESAFSYCSGLTSITIPNSVTTIGRGAFYGCSGLTSITIPGSVTAIGGLIFAGCTNLTNIHVEVDNLSYLSVDGVLYDKSQTTLICFPGGKTGDVIIPDCITTIWEGAFSDCSGLISVTIPNSVTAIGNSAFSDCSGLTSITIPNSVTTIGDYAFSHCSALTSITIPNSITTIEYGTFSSCSALTSVTIPNSVTTIGNFSFDKCNALTSITIPQSVTTIGNYAFETSNSLTSIISLAVTPPACGRYPFAKINKEECTLHVPAESREAYRQAAEWRTFTLTEDIVYVSSIQLNETEVSIEEGATFSLTADVLPAEATIKNLQWETSDASCVTVDESGLLTAHANGTATITVRSFDGKAEATCTVTVVPTTGLEAVSTEGPLKVEVFTLTGVKVADSTEGLPAGIYLVRQGSAVRKVVVR